MKTFAPAETFKNNFRFAPLVLAAGLFLPATGYAPANVTVPPIFGDHMVLQQDAKLPVWGTADPGEKIKVAVGADSAGAVAGPDGKWRVDLAPVPAGGAPLEMTITGKNTLKFTDVLAGDVWLASGQSNMQFSMGSTQFPDAKPAIQAANNPQIRFFAVRNLTAVQPKTVLAGSWVVCTPATVGRFSAVGYYFAGHIQKELHRPVGLICSYWGGTPAEAWTSLDALRKLPAQAAKVKVVEDEIANYDRNAAAWPPIKAKYEADLKQWNDEVGTPYRAAMQKFNVEDAQAVAAGTPRPVRPVLSRSAPRSPIGPDGEAHQASVLFNAMIYPLIPYAIKGVIWYQGESNAGECDLYRELFGAMITDWRTRWDEGDFPFLYVQLANFMARRDVPTDSQWARLREAQLQTLALPKTGMAVIIDIGMAENIHPQDKADVGLRLSLAAKQVAYGRKLVYSGPIYDSMKVAGHKIIVSFKDTGRGLIIGSAPVVYPRNPAASTTELQGFAISGADKNWVWAKAQIEGGTVVVESDQVSAPVAVRYAWADNPVCNLYNKEGLPASPFRTDDWPYAAPPPRHPPAHTALAQPPASGTSPAPKTP